jgi:ADP-ribose pyrophosphatase YjhB (NUDIX family)
MMNKFRNPIPTVDIIIEIQRKDGKQGIVLIKRKNPPDGWAIPGGFVDYGESLEEAAVREASRSERRNVSRHPAQEAAPYLLLPGP